MTSTHRMLEYIYQSPKALKDSLADNEAKIEKLAQHVRERGIKRVVISGVGSSYTAGMIAAPLFTRYCSLPAYIVPSTELAAYQSVWMNADTLIVAVSRSGERGWVVDSFRTAVQNGAMGVAITGNPEGLLAQSSPEVLLSSEGPEAVFPKTKSVMAHAGLLARLALAMADPLDSTVSILLQALKKMPQTVTDILQTCDPQVQALVPALFQQKAMMLSGTLGNYGVALEGSLKMQEASGLVVLGNETGNMLHGPWGTVTSDWLVTLLVTEYDQALAETNIHLANQIGAKSLAIVESGLSLKASPNYIITLPCRVERFLSGLAYLPPVQLLTYYWALAGGLDPDAPANVDVVLDAMLPEGRQEPEMRNK